MPKALVAFFLGIFSFFLIFFIGETASHYLDNAGLIVAFVVMAAYFFICQFLLSRGNPNAYRKDWPIMLALDAMPLLMILGMALAEKWPVVLVQGLGILLSCCGGTYAGALAASRVARKRAAQR